MLGVLACSRALRVYMLTCSRAWGAYVHAYLRAWRAYVLTCLACLRTWRAYVLGVFTCLRASCACVCTCVHVLMKYFIFLRVCVLGVLFCLISFTFQHLNLKILTAKKLCALLIWTYFLFTFWSYLKQYQFFTIYIFTYYINFCWTHCFCLI